MQTKYIFLTGGVCSGLGKGITAASLGRLLKARNFRVTIQKCDPYLNMDPGLLSPYQHGEVYVTEDGAEVDLDLGHYERYIDENLSQSSSISTGKIYWDVLNEEKKGTHKGSTIQVIPHITNAIKSYITDHPPCDIVISEIGGTVGDIESLPFLEAIRQLSEDIGNAHVMYAHVTLVPYLDFAGEAKTKPSQHSVKELLSLGIKPDVLVCRTQRPLGNEMRRKLAQFCHVNLDCIIENRNAKCLYDVPLMLEKEHFADVVCKGLGLNAPKPDLSEWRQLTQKKPTQTITIGLVGKYVEFRDAYLSVAEALRHAGIAQDVSINLEWIHAEKIYDGNAADFLQNVQGIILPGGYGKRGTAGIIQAARYAREHKIPCLSIGLGMQCALIEFARNAANQPDADSIECNADTTFPLVVPITPVSTDSKDEDLIVPMRKGAKEIKLTPGTKLHNAYQHDTIRERFRHRYMINNNHHGFFEKNGLLLSAFSENDTHIEGFELPGDVHPWFVGVQFYAEFKSRITNPSPLYEAFVRAAVDA